MLSVLTLSMVLSMCLANQESMESVFVDCVPTLPLDSLFRHPFP